MKYGVGSGRLMKSLAASLKSPVSAGCLNANYSDSGRNDLLWYDNYDLEAGSYCWGSQYTGDDNLEFLA